MDTWVNGQVHVIVKLLPFALVTEGRNFPCEYVDNGGFLLFGFGQGVMC